MALVDALPCLPFGTINLINMTRAFIRLSSSSCIPIPVFFATHWLFFFFWICDILALKSYLARINSNISGWLFSYQFFFHQFRIILQTLLTFSESVYITVQFPLPFPPKRKRVKYPIYAFILLSFIHFYSPLKNQLDDEISALHQIIQILYKFIVVL